MDYSKILNINLGSAVCYSGFREGQTPGVSYPTYDQIKEDLLTLEILVANRVVSKTELVKILGRGELKAKLNITVHKFTATAKAAIEAAGGEVVTL